MARASPQGDKVALRQAKAAWWWWRPRGLRSEGSLMLPRLDARRMARKGGKAEMPRVRGRRCRPSFPELLPGEVLDPYACVQRREV